MKQEKKKKRKNQLPYFRGSWALQKEASSFEFCFSVQTWPK